MLAFQDELVLISSIYSRKQSYLHTHFKYVLRSFDIRDKSFSLRSLVEKQFHLKGADPAGRNKLKAFKTTSAAYHGNRW